MRSGTHCNTLVEILHLNYNDCLNCCPLWTWYITSKSSIRNNEFPRFAKREVGEFHKRKLAHWNVSHSLSFFFPMTCSNAEFSIPSGHRLSFLDAALDLVFPRFASCFPWIFRYIFYHVIFFDNEWGWYITTCNYIVLQQDTFATKP